MACTNGFTRSAAEPDADAADQVADGEYSLLLTAIERNRWNMTLAAAQLGISRNTLYRKIKLLGIALPHARHS
jgi:sigma-54 dependent transcriptional regulator, acetoin dehydrogenase operon transcriptional activator AcoR